MHRNLNVPHPKTAEQIIVDIYNYILSQCNIIYVRRNISYPAPHFETAEVFPQLTLTNKYENHTVVDL